MTCYMLFANTKPTIRCFNFKSDINLLNCIRFNSFPSITLEVLPSKVTSADENTEAKYSLLNQLSPASGYAIKDSKILVS